MDRLYGPNSGPPVPMSFTPPVIPAHFEVTVSTRQGGEEDGRVVNIIGSGGNAEEVLKGIVALEQGLSNVAIVQIAPPQYRKP